MVKVKICGITNKADALHAAASGCDGLGFVFYKKSPRYISPGNASRVIKSLPPGVLKVGVFVNSRESFIRKTARSCRLDMLQFHGNESPEFCARFKGLRVIKAFRVKERIEFERIARYRTFAYLFDSFSPSGFGGTGKTFSWDFLARELGRLKTPVFLAGGLDDRNVRRAVKTVNPEWVDASSRLEASPGRKNPGKVKRFIDRARGRRFVKDQ